MEANLDIMVSVFTHFNISYPDVQHKPFSDHNTTNFINLLKIIFNKSPLRRGIEG